MYKRFNITVFQKHLRENSQIKRKMLLQKMHVVGSLGQQGHCDYPNLD